MLIERNGFTLLELLIVIGILSILSTAAVVVINPVKFTKEARDAIRLGDLNNIHQSLQFARVAEPQLNFGALNTLYISLPDTNGAPANCDQYTLPALPSGWSYACALESDFKNVNGTGWIPVNFESIAKKSPTFSTLPIDPRNTAENLYYYTYAIGSWELTARLESTKHATRKINDGGLDPLSYEIGSRLNLTPFASGMISAWGFEESGANVADFTGSNTGTLMNNAKRSPGKIGLAIDFDGIDDYVTIANNLTVDLNNRNKATFAAWIYPRTLGESNEGRILDKGGGSGFGNGYAFSLAPNNSLQFMLNANIGDWSATSQSNVFAFNQWQHVAAVYDGENGMVTFYVNGSPAGTDAIQSSSAIIGNASNLRIGIRATDLNRDFNGLIDEPRIYSRALSAVEIQQIVASESAISTGSPSQPTPSVNLSLTAPGSIYNVNDTIEVTIALNTNGKQTVGVDAMFSYNPAKLQLIQINPAGPTPPQQYLNTSGSVFEQFPYFNEASGNISFSAAKNAQLYYTGIGTVAKITFKALSTGSTSITFNFTNGVLIDSNVAFQGGDILESVSNLSVTIQ